MLENQNIRECGECTKCCQGHLTGNAHGHSFGPNKPCYWLRKDGCGIYNYRPYNPCKTFVCEWKTNFAIPESFRPDKCNAIMIKREKDDGVRLDVVEAGDVLSADVLQLIIGLYSSHKYDYVHYERNGQWFELKR